MSSDSLGIKESVSYLQRQKVAELLAHKGNHVSDNSNIHHKNQKLKWKFTKTSF